MSAERLATTLKDLDYTYPYHQAIGFYLERSGAYDESEIDVFRGLPLDYDFYLDYQIAEAEYSEEWRLYFPKGLRCHD